MNLNRWEIERKRRGATRKDERKGEKKETRGREKKEGVVGLGPLEA
jgi:hypothetical protein